MFGERLRALRKSKKLTMKELGKVFNLAESTISGYESGARKPDIDQVKKFADYFGVPTDYLLGRTDDQSDHIFNVAGQEIRLTPDEAKLFGELRKYPVMFHDLASDPEKKIKELIKLYKMKKILDDDDEEEGDGFGELED